MKYLFYQTSQFLFSSMSLLEDKAITYAQKGHEVYFVVCDGCMNICFCNMQSRKSQCLVCKMATRKALKLLPKGVHIINMNRYWDNSRFDTEFDYSNYKELKNIRYKGVDIGFAVLSSYISITRNAYPKIDKDSKPFFDKIITQTCKLTDVLEKIFKDINPDGIFIFNGRLFEMKPAVDLATVKNINYTVLEVKGGHGEPYYREEYYNRIPQTIDGLWKACLDAWEDDSLTLDEKIKLGNSFYTNKRNGKPAGDKVYTEKQKKGKLPNDWNVNKINITIFNSSEDEFSAIGDDFDSKAVFHSQIEGIKFILEEMKNDDRYHFYLRIHPNLSNIKYKYHVDLLKLPDEYQNITVIPGDADISSYDLMDKSDKIIVFGSTMGVESVYWGKAVILLAGSFYYNADLCYIPNDKNEIVDLIKEELPPKNKDNTIKYGFFILQQNESRKYENIDYNFKIESLFGRSLMIFPYLKLFGSSKLYSIYLTGLRLILRLFDKNINAIPRDEE